MPQAWKNRSKVSKFIKNAWTNMNTRCGKYTHLQTRKKCKTYDTTLILITREEFKAWCLQQKDLIESLDRPSIDRIDKSGNYSLDNMAIIELQENIRKDKTSHNGITGICSACATQKLSTLFTKDNRRISGRSSVCKDCANKANRRRYNGSTS